MKDANTRRNEYRKRKKEVIIKKIGLAAILLIVLTVLIAYAASTNRGYIIDPTELITVHFSGFEGAGGAEIEVDNQLLTEKMKEAYEKNRRIMWPFSNGYSESDYEKLFSSFKCVLDKDSKLENKDELTITVSLNSELAEKLDVHLMHEKLPVTVDGLAQGHKIEEEEFFKDLTISFNGISPVIQVEIVNETKDSFLKTVEYEVVSDKEFFANGDTFKVLAKFDEEKARLSQYIIDGKNFEREYKVESDDVSYVVSANQISADVLKSAIDKGLTYFTDANEYGLRIFTEAGLIYTWKGTNGYTFKWSNMRVLSSYFQTVKEQYRGDKSKPYNYLELVYEVHISQANGTGCEAEAVVCFHDLKIDENGNIDINPESGQLFSASYRDEEIKANLKGWFGDVYDIEKYDLVGMGLKE